MTTQELKSYIDRILGNSVRLLLPSYWWKRAFGAVADSMVAKDEVKTINGESIVGEGDLKIDGSGPLRVWVPIATELTEEQKVENADTFTKLINGYGELVYMVYQVVDVDMEYTYTQPVLLYVLGTEDGLRVAYLISDAAEIVLLPDGTIELE